MIIRTLALLLLSIPAMHPAIVPADVTACAAPTAISAASDARSEGRYIYFEESSPSDRMRYYVSQLVWVEVKNGGIDPTALREAVQTFHNNVLSQYDERVQGSYFVTSPEGWSRTTFEGKRLDEIKSLRDRGFSISQVQ